MCQWKLSCHTHISDISLSNFRHSVFYFTSCGWHNSPGLGQHDGRLYHDGQGYSLVSTVDVQFKSKEKSSQKKRGFCATSASVGFLIDSDELHDRGMHIFVASNQCVIGDRVRLTAVQRAVQSLRKRCLRRSRMSLSEISYDHKIQCREIFT